MIYGIILALAVQEAPMISAGSDLARSEMDTGAQVYVVAHAIILEASQVDFKTAPRATHSPTTGEMRRLIEYQ
ncbi:MAG: hypothetical protein ABL918_00660 [Chakrabartia sp.]